MAYYAKLNGSNLPVQFSYKPYVPKKRISITPTAGGVIVQYANPQIVHGEGLLAWTIQCCYPTEYQALYDLYNTITPVSYTFEGYWNEVLSVLFNQLDTPTIRGRLFAVSGAFVVQSVVTPQAASCKV